MWYDGKLTRLCTSAITSHLHGLCSAPRGGTEAQKAELDPVFTEAGDRLGHGSIANSSMAFVNHQADDAELWSLEHGCEKCDMRVKIHIQDNFLIHEPKVLLPGCRACSLVQVVVEDLRGAEKYTLRCPKCSPLVQLARGQLHSIRLKSSWTDIYGAPPKENARLTWLLSPTLEMPIVLTQAVIC